MKNAEKYIVISKEVQTEAHMSHNTGKSVLISFAAKPMFNTFYWMKKQGQSLPSYYDKKTAIYARNKYCKGYEVVKYSEVIKEFNKYEYGK